MSTKTLATGWVVQLTIPRKRAEVAHLPWPGAVITSPIYQYFNVAIGEAEKAAEAARKKARAANDVPTRVVRALSISEIAAIKLRAGEARASS